LQRTAGTEFACGRKLSKIDTVSARGKAHEPHLLTRAANQFWKESLLTWTQRFARAFDLNKPEVKYTATDVTGSHKAVWMGVRLPVAVACAAKKTVARLLAALAPKLQRPLVPSQLL
jgi:hypothetical protein